MVIKIYTKNQLDDNVKEKVVNAIRTYFGLETKYNLIDTKKRKILNILYFFFWYIYYII